MRDLLSDNTAFDICNKEIGEGFIEGTLDNEDIEDHPIWYASGWFVGVGVELGAFFYSTYHLLNWSLSSNNHSLFLRVLST